MNRTVGVSGLGVGGSGWGSGVGVGFSGSDVGSALYVVNLALTHPKLEPYEIFSHPSLTS